MRNIIRTGKNPYIIATSLFLLWILFFDNNSYLRRRKFTSTYQKILTEKSYYEKEIEHLEDQLFRLEHDPDFPEKLARERYLFRKKGEDVYFISPN